MKKVKIFSILSFVLIFTKCASLPFDTEPPFTITKTTYRNWSGGVRGVQGTNINISYT